LSKGRKFRPKWQVEIDAYLFQYVDDPKTIRLQAQRIRELELTGTKTTPAYSVRGGAGGETITKEERYVQDMEEAREQIKISRERRRLVESLLKDHFNTEERRFIELFWLTVKPLDRGLIQIRNQAVIREVGWLRDPDRRDRPSDTFYDWRRRIYTKWWQLLWPDKPKEETRGDYIEDEAVKRESAYLNAEQLRGL